MPNLFIIAGCNGAGKTTASFTMLPELLNVREFVNADEIARGISPFQPERVAIEAGRIMLRRIDELVSQRMDFAFETTLATRSFVSLIKRAKGKGYRTILIYYLLEQVGLAIERVRNRVREGGHSIPEETVIRRYSSGMRNFLNLYTGEVDVWLAIDNSLKEQELIAVGGLKTVVFNIDKWKVIQNCGKK